jgi:hypothetical protein
VYAMRRRRRMRSGSSTGPDDVALHSAARMQSAYFNSRAGRRCGERFKGMRSAAVTEAIDERATGPGRRCRKRQARGVDGEGGRFRGVVGLNERVHVQQGHGGSAGELVVRPSQESGCRLRAGRRGLVDPQAERRRAGEQAPWRPKGTQAGIGQCHKRHMKQLPAHAPRRGVFYARIERPYQALLREASQRVCVPRRSVDALEAWAGGQTAAARLRGSPPASTSARCSIFSRPCCAQGCRASGCSRCRNRFGWGGAVTCRIVAQGRQAGRRLQCTEVAASHGINNLRHCMHSPSKY